MGKVEVSALVSKGEVSALVGKGEVSAWWVKVRYLPW